MIECESIAQRRRKHVVCCVTGLKAHYYRVFQGQYVIFRRTIFRLHYIAMASHGRMVVSSRTDKRLRAGIFEIEGLRL